MQAPEEADQAQPDGRSPRPPCAGSGLPLQRCLPLRGSPRSEAASLFAAWLRHHVFRRSRPRQTARYTWCNNTQSRQLVPVAAFSGEGVVTLQHATRSAQISKKLSCSVIRRLEPSGTLHLIRLHYALYSVITKERFAHNTMPHRNSGRRRSG
jgi:hypothetical protein